MSAEQENGIGKPVRRVEDLRLLTGNGCFSDDVSIEGQAHIAMARSPHAHARLISIDADAARAMPGVLAVLTGEDFAGAGYRGIPHSPNQMQTMLTKDGAAAFETPANPIVLDKVRHVGEVIAVIIAQSAAEAQDASEAVQVGYEVLPAVVDVYAALAEGAPTIWDGAQDNVDIDCMRGTPEAADAAFEKADHITTLDLSINRVSGVPMEPRAAVAEFDENTGRLTLWAGSQNVVLQKNGLAKVFGMEAENVRVVAKDVGGGFGTRNLLPAESVLTVWAALHLKRAVKWSGTRAEMFVSDPQARELYTHAELALDKDGKFLAIRSSHICNLGTETLLFVSIARGMDVTTGVYDIPAAGVRMRCVFTNCVPLSVYRGAGRPEHIYIIERLIDTAAREMGRDPLEIRAQNFIQPKDIPYPNPIGTNFDSGEFLAGQDMAVAHADMDGYPARRDDAIGRGMYYGQGVCNYIETATGMPPERVEMEVLAEGKITAVCGTMASGQGHETSYPPMIMALLGVPFDAIDIHEGDTDRVKNGSGSHSSRSMRLMSLLMSRGAGEIIDQGKRIAAHAMEASENDIEFEGGDFLVSGTDRRLGIFEVAALAAGGTLPDDLPDRLYSEQDISTPLPNFPNGSHVCEVEIDPETGDVRIARYVSIDDVGNVINPLLVDGQTHGGIAQGAGQALMENCAYDPANGQQISGSFMDYAMPRA
ncbi:MAG: xanthine dehydrogenase family protein molybdopterin-binding subunit, partial [Rhodospirillales bacterium]|nr:xanthine dehydrogenase family protein molybdopterin-binding subunit [Rhodospirillales bacterium]